MDKVLVILSDNNKGKFISKGFASAFKDLSYFVYEKKIYDLNVEEIKKLVQKLYSFFGRMLHKLKIYVIFFKITALQIQFLYIVPNY